MAIFRETCGILMSEEPTKEFYRFEGAKTCSRFDFNNTQDNGYIYISSSLDHHMYFTMRRLKQMIHTSLLEEEDIPFVARTIRSSEDYPRIKDFILYGEAIDAVYSHRLVCPKIYGQLLKENCVRNTQPKEKRKVERVDRRVYGGGYGIAEEWRELLGYLTYFDATTKISRKDIIEIINQMRRTGKITNKDHMQEIITDLSRYHYRLNPNLLSDFNKYNILNAIETIAEKELVVQGSSLWDSPRKVEREVIEEYERGREKTLTLLDKRKI